MSSTDCAWCGDEDAPHIRPDLTYGDTQRLCDVCADEYDDVEEVTNVIDRITNAVDAHIRDGGGDYDELQDTVARNLPRCETCRWWTGIGDDDIGREINLIRPWHPVTYQRFSEAESHELFGHTVRICQNPKILFYQRPAADGAAVVDGSEYRASLITGESFGCILHETH